MAACNNELRAAGTPNHGPCAVCWYGPCKQAPAQPPAPAPAWPPTAAHLATLIAAKVFPTHFDRQRRDELTVLLAAFAAEIKRSAIEP